MEVKNKKICSLLQPEETVVAVVGQQKSLCVIFGLLIAVIVCGIFFLLCLAFLFTGYYIAFAVFGGAVVLALIIASICILIMAGTSAYVITTKNLYLGSMKEKSNGLVIVMPLKTLRIINEQAIRNKKSGISSIVLYSPDRQIHGKLPKTDGFFRMGLTTSLIKANVNTIQNGKLKMKYVKNPETICDLLKKF